MIRTGIRYDEDGRPVGSVSRDEGPSVGLQASGWKGSLVVGRSGAKMRPEGSQSAEAERTRRFREKHGGRKAK